MSPDQTPKLNSTSNRSATGEPSQSDRLTRGRPTRWAWQFGLPEFHGMLIAIAILYFCFIRVIQGEEPPIEFGVAPRDRMFVRGGAFLFATIIALGGTYLSSRLATRYGIERTWRRLLLQAICTVFLIPPLLCIAAFVLPLLSFLIPGQWRGSDQDGAKRLQAPNRVG